MVERVELPAMVAQQAAGWHALMDLYERKPTGWTLVGGQMVHLLCAERGSFPQRATHDVDTVLDVRAEPGVLREFTGHLVALGFEPQTTPDGVQHRWVRDGAVVDVLIPRHVGERAAGRVGAGGGRTLQTPGAQQALDRSEAVEVVVHGRTGAVCRPSMLGALVAKAAAWTVVLDPARERHLEDLLVLGALVRRGDVVGMTRRDRDRLANAVGAIRLREHVLDRVRSGELALRLLEQVLSRPV